MARIRGPQDLPGKIEGDTFLTPKYEQKDPSPRFRGPQDLIPIPKAKEDSVISQSTEAASTASDKLPKLDDPKLTFGQKLNAGLDKIFNMQENDPESYRKVMSGFDIYLRGQRGDDIITAITGNSKFNAEQASALLQANLAANNLKLSEMKVLKAEKEATTPDKVEPGELEIAKNIIKKDVNKDDLEAVANFIASRAKTIQLNTGMGYSEAISVAYQIAQEEGGGLKNVASIYGKEFTIDPEGTSSTKGVINLSTLKSKYGDNYKTKQKEAEEQGYIINPDG